MEENKKRENKVHYGALDGLRTIAAIGIVLMHIAANNDYEISGFVYDNLIGSFGNFVFLFMVISSFGMCCGYYDKIINNKISLTDFYKKRFLKTLPFFSLLVVIDLIISPSLSSLYESFADITLLFGFLPDAGNITVIGVGWFLGIVFVFYLIFPFFCTLIETKRRAWIAFAISLIYNYVCYAYFDVGRTNILYSACFFISGGLIFLYKDEIREKINKHLMLLITWITIIAYYAIGGYAISCLLVSASLLMYAITSIGGGILQNRFTTFFSSISLEVYLSHMVIFRAIEIFHLNTIIGNGWVQYIFTCALVLAGTIVFSYVAQKAIKRVERKALTRDENINNK